jgi:hypothetical protein
MTFRNVDGSTETMESGNAQLYSVSYLLTGTTVNAGTVKNGPTIPGYGGAAETARICAASECRAKTGPNLNALLVSSVLSFTVLASVSLGIMAAYCLVNGILHLFAAQRPAQTEPQPVLLARNAQAGAD